MQGVSLIVVQYGEIHLLLSLLNSLDNHPDESIISEIVIVNNGDQLTDSQKEECDRKCEQIEKIFVENNKQTYSSAVNEGFRQANHDLIIISNNDIEWVDGESISSVINDIQEGRCDIASPQLRYPDGTTQKNWGEFHSISEEVKNLALPSKIKSRIFRKGPDELYPVEGYIIGAFLVTTRPIFEDLGGFDESFDFYGEDIDFCYRADQYGYRRLIDTSSELIHIGGGSSNDDDFDYIEQLYNSRRIFLEKHHSKPYVYSYALVRLAVILERLAIYYIISIIYNGEWKKRYNSFKKELSGFFGILPD